MVQLHAKRKVNSREPRYDSLDNTVEIEESCNWKNKNNCPLDEKRLTTNIFYEEQITSIPPNYKDKI